MTREEYFAQAVYSHRHKPQIVALVQALLNRPDITQEELAAIKEIVAAK